MYFKAFFKLNNGYEEMMGDSFHKLGAATHLWERLRFSSAIHAPYNYLYYAIVIIIYSPKVVWHDDRNNVPCEMDIQDTQGGLKK